jgi:MFS family permease
MEYFPNNKGLISGIIMGSYGLGSFIFNIVATKIVNPNGESADIKTDDPNLNLFAPAVANRVPMLLRILCMIWVGLVLLSACFISIPAKPKSDNTEKI